MNKDEEANQRSDDIRAALKKQDNSLFGVDLKSISICIMVLCILGLLPYIITKVL